MNRVTGVRAVCRPDSIGWRYIGYGGGETRWLSLRWRPSPQVPFPSVSYVERGHTRVALPLTRHPTMGWVRRPVVTEPVRPFLYMLICKAWTQGEDNYAADLARFRVDRSMIGFLFRCCCTICNIPGWSRPDQAVYYDGRAEFFALSERLEEEHPVLREIEEEAEHRIFREDFIGDLVQTKDVGNPENERVETDGNSVFIYHRDKSAQYESRVAYTDIDTSTPRLPILELWELQGSRQALHNKKEAKT